MSNADIFVLVLTQSGSWACKKHYVFIQRQDSYRKRPVKCKKRTCNIITFYNAVRQRKKSLISQVLALIEHMLYPRQGPFMAEQFHKFCQFQRQQSVLALGLGRISPRQNGR